jgi:thymidylate kinase
LTDLDVVRGRPRSSLGGTLTLLLGFHRTLAQLRCGRNTPILVFDRYFVDEILRAAFDHNFRPAWAWRPEALLPRPDLVFYLDLPPDEALRREKDKDLDSAGIHRKKDLYDRWARGLAAPNHPPVVCVRTDRDREEVREEIVAQPLNFLGIKGYAFTDAAPLPGYVGR